MESQYLIQTLKNDLKLQRKTGLSIAEQAGKARNIIETMLA